jgi:hypothetical protein
LTEDAGHLSAALAAAYVSGECNPAQIEEIEKHCIACAECREQLAVLLRVKRAEMSAEEQEELPPLAALGLEAGAKARQKLRARFMV